MEVMEYIEHIAIKLECMDPRHTYRLPLASELRKNSEIKGDFVWHTELKLDGFSDALLAVFNKAEALDNQSAFKGNSGNCHSAAFSGIYGRLLRARTSDYTRVVAQSYLPCRFPEARQYTTVI